MFESIASGTAASSSGVIASGMMPVVVSLGVLVAGGVAYCAYLLRRRTGALDQIGQRLSRLACDVEADLAGLGLGDADGEPAMGWNRLVEKVSSIQEELDNHQLRHQARETIDRCQTQYMSSLLNSMPGGLVTVLDDWTITFANEAVARMLGAEPGALEGRLLTEFFPDALDQIDLGRGGHIDRVCDAHGGEQSYRVISIDGAKRSGGRETALYVSDTSAQRDMERSRSQFLYHVTHELRTPLTNIRAYAETLSEGVLNDPNALRECYNVIMGETQRLSRLVEDILSLSQLEAGAARLQMGEVQIARLIRQVVEDMQAQADEKSLDLVLSLPAKVPVIEGDKDRLAVVLTNLVGNAIKYTPSGGIVEVSCSEEDERLRIAVRDTGIGIGPAECEKVFEKFYRSTDEKVSEIPGTGLGLALAMEIARAHSGTIELTSEPGNGSTFTLVLPVGSLAAVQT